MIFPVKLILFRKCSQFSNLGALRNIAIADKPLLAMRYDEAIGRQLSEYARDRAPNIYFESMLTIEQFGLTRSIIIELSRPISRHAEQTMPGARTQNKGKGGKKKGDPAKAMNPPQPN